MATRLHRIGRGVLPLALLPILLSAQGRPHTRKGFWLNFGGGPASAGCEGCDGRETAAGWTYALGGTPSQKVVIGFVGNVWQKDVGGTTFSLASYAGMLRYYPSADGGFYLLGGFGGAAVEGDLSGIGKERETGTGFMLGLGYDFRVGKSVSLTPFLNGWTVHTTNNDYTVNQIGVGVTMH